MRNINSQNKNDLLYQSDIATNILKGTTTGSRIIFTLLFLCGALSFVTVILVSRYCPESYKATPAIEAILLACGTTFLASIIPLWVTNVYFEKVFEKTINKFRDIIRMREEHGVESLARFDIDGFFDNIRDGDVIKIMSSTLYNLTSVNKLAKKLNDNPNVRAYLLLMDTANPIVQCRAFDVCKGVPFALHIPTESRQTTRIRPDQFLREHNMLCESIEEHAHEHAEKAKSSDTTKHRSRLQAILANDFFGISLYLRKRLISGSDCSELYVGFYLNDSAEATEFFKIVHADKFGVFTINGIESYFNEKWDRNLLMLPDAARLPWRYEFLTSNLQNTLVSQLPQIILQDYNNSGFPKSPKHSQQMAET